MARLTHVRLLVSDLQACLSFYQDVLGLEPLWADKDGHYASFRTGDIVLALSRKRSMAEAVGSTGKPERADTQDAAALIMAVNDVDAVYQELAARGVSFITEPLDRSHWGIRTAHFRDPDGNLIEINTPLRS